VLSPVPLHPFASQVGADRNRTLKLFMAAPSSAVKLLARKARAALEAVRQRRGDDGGQTETAGNGGGQEEEDVENYVRAWGAQHIGLFLQQWRAATRVGVVIAFRRSA
jgi:hypothetical protein